MQNLESVLKIILIELLEHIMCTITYILFESGSIMYTVT